MTSELAQIRVTATTLGDLLMIAADKYPDTNAIVLPDQRCTFTELRDRAITRARTLHALGIGPKDHVGLLLPTCMDFAESLFAIAMLGAVTVPINARYKPPEIAYVTENADLVAIITTDEFDEAVNYVERIQAAFPDLKENQDPKNLSINQAPELRRIVLYGSATAPGMLSQDQLEEMKQQVDEDEIHLRRIQTRVGSTALILYTSGTTSNPKGCMIAHESIVRNSAALGRRYELTHEDSFWSPLPMFHIAAILPMVTIFDAGGTYVTTPHFEAGQALQMMQDEHVTASYPSFWTIMSDLVNHPDFPTTDLSSMKLMNSNFAVQPGFVGETMEKAMPGTIFVGSFGMTEASGTVSTNRLSDTREQRFTRLGTPLPGIEVKIMDPESGQKVATGEKGDTWIRGNGIFTEYYKSPDKTAEALDEDGWFHSGDICSINEDGQLLFHGRLKDMLKVGGENVAAVEIETCLQQHPAVKLAQVVGVPDARLQEVAAAYIELNPGEETTEQALIDFCKDKIAGFKVPRYVRFIDEWPMSSTKIQKFKLQQQIMEELGV
ncbi:MAG: class I adenylate-forming enzyme family protein [Gammaproteobacteria bacterium]|nr:class I adenylate-forming enzyme family protein [Gammaproteobacteria bacterium]